jgi:hypothetical protein
MNFLKEKVLPGLKENSPSTPKDLNPDDNVPKLERQDAFTGEMPIVLKPRTEKETQTIRNQQKNFSVPLKAD